MASIAACNVALSEIRASPIVSIDDGTPEADACAQVYDDCYQTLLQCHEWGFAKKRVELALFNVNDRPTEWLYAYAPPADLGVMGRVVYPFQSPLSGVYYAWPYNYPRPPAYFVDFVYDGSSIYTNLAGAWLEYSSNNIDESVWPAMFRRALELDLASRLAISLRDDRQMKGDLLQQFEAAKRRAMADDNNRYPRQDERIIDEVALARSQ